MKIVNKLLVIIGILLCVCLLEPRLAYAASEPIKIGMSAAFTGPSSSLGIELYQGSMAYFDYINKSGGINGHTLIIQAYIEG